jgi:hypothetical protein
MSNERHADGRIAERALETLVHFLWGTFADSPVCVEMHLPGAFTL